MYLHNKYSKYYFSIISNAKSRITNIGYTEIHHIIPKSMGGNDSSENLVELTAREHFICHLLLPKMTVGEVKDKLSYAAWSMANQKRPCQDRYKVTSRIYESLRTEYSKLVAARLTGKVGANKGKKFSEETKKKMSLAAFGRKPSPRAIEAVRQARKGVPPSNKGKPMSEEQKEKLRAAWAKKKLAASS